MLFYNVKANPRALAGEHIACPKIAFKNKGVVFFGDSKPLINDIYLEVFILFRSPKLYIGILVGIFYGVVNKLDKANAIIFSSKDTVIPSISLGY